MNSIRTADRLEKAWLKVNKAPSPAGKVTVQGELFDGTIFTVTLEEYEVEKQDDANLYFVPVGYNGDRAGFSEVVLPKPVLNFGHTIRVATDSVVKWREYRKIKEIREQQNNQETP